MIDLPGSASVNGVSKGPAFINRDGGEVNAVGDIPDRIDVGNIRALICIYGNAAILETHAGTLKAETIQPGASAGGHQHTTAGDGEIISQVNTETARFTIDGFDVRTEQDMDTAVPHPLKNRIGQLVIKSTQQSIASHHHGD